MSALPTAETPYVPAVNDRVVRASGKLPFEHGTVLYLDATLRITRVRWKSNDDGTFYEGTHYFEALKPVRTAHGPKPLPVPSGHKFKPGDIVVRRNGMFPNDRGVVVDRITGNIAPVIVRWRDGREGEWDDAGLTLIAEMDPKHIDESLFMPNPATPPARPCNEIIKDLIRDKNDGSKYDRRIRDKYDHDASATVDVYEVILAWGVTDPGCQQALKKILQPGDRARGTYVEDIEGAIVALQRSLTIAKRSAKEEKRFGTEPGQAIPVTDDRGTITDYLERQDAEAAKRPEPESSSTVK